jgi:VRR-NUC domain
LTAWRQLDLLKHPRRQRGTRPPPAPEFRTHCAIADALRVGIAPGWIWTHFPAGEKRDKGAAARLKRMGLRPGFPDFLLISPTGVHCWLELKRGRARLNWAQDLFRTEMLERGVPHAVARSFDEAIRVLTAWGAIRLRVAA